MKYANPDKPFSAKNWHADAISDRMGFAMRNESATRQQSGAVIPIDSLGRDFAGKAYLSQYRGNVADVAAARYPNWSMATAAPGIMVLEYEPVISPDGNTRIIDDVYTQRWAEIRLFNNGADYTQPADLAAESVAFMLLESYLAEVERLFTAMRTGAQAGNEYWRPEVLVRALGFSAVGAQPNFVNDDPMTYPLPGETPYDADDLTDANIAANYTAWITYYNTQIIGFLNAMKWMNTTFAGGHRWAALNREIYKDTSADTFCCQTYILRPRSHWRFGAALQTAQAAKKGEQFSSIVRAGKALKAGTPFWAWSFWTPVNEGAPDVEHTRPTPNLANYGVSSGCRYHSVWGFLRFIRSFIWNMFYDSAGADVQALLNTIQKRSEATATQLGIDSLSYEEYPYEGKQLQLTYDWDMLSAIHNSTLAPNLGFSKVTQIPATGQLTQTVAIAASQNTASATWAMRTTKFLELPTQAATQEQLINALQWHIAIQGDMTSDIPISGRFLGSDVLVRAFVFRFTDPNVATQVATGKILATIRVTDISDYQFKQYSLVSGAEYIDQPTYFRALLRMQFDSSPLFYTYHAFDDDGDPRGELDPPLTDMECMFPAPMDAVTATKEQYMYNFWGYPLRLATTGQFNSGDVKFTAPDSVPLTEAGTQK